uniref:Uncharacterized protein TCIL3000_3_3460 n=1 Tax=Trypanosoma congolense (strain IL3000) TaxID=1068625 RepID=G0UKK6_TRYCI|nr:unnamed protein product [Trypanosoma congolense IL3000]
MPPPELPSVRQCSQYRGLPARLAQQLSLKDGVVRLMETGVLAADTDLEALFATEGVFKTAKAQFHPMSDRKLPRVMTKVSSYARYNGILLDIEDIRKIPPKMNLQDLHEWENRVEEVSEAPRSSCGAIEYGGEYGSCLKLPARDDVRTYSQLLDEYSMHEFIIRKGTTLRSTPEFASFKRMYSQCWGNIEHIVCKLEEFLKMYDVELAFVDGKKVAELATFQVENILQREDLLKCLANHEDVEKLTRNVSQMYAVAGSGVERAAEKIQATWRMYHQRVAYQHLLDGTRAATVVQRAWALYKLHCTTRKALKALREKRLLQWKHTMEEFVKQWPEIKKSKRRIIHIPSLSFPRFHAKHVPFYLPQQMGQLTRLVDLRDPDVEVVIISPMRPEQEVLDYYLSLLDSSGIPDAKKRLTLLVPEEAKRLPGTLSLTRLTILSSRLMKCLASLGKGRHTYIVPGVIGPEELSFAIELNIPMLSADPNVAQAFGTKTGGQRLMKLASVATMPGAYGIKNSKELLTALATLMTHHPEVSRWLVKLDTESGSRGHAYFDVNRISMMKSLTDGEWTFESALAELEQNAGRRARLISPLSYPNWDAYTKMFDLVGGCVEAVPNRIKSTLSANLLVEPTGTVSLNSIVEPMLAPAYTVIGCQYPFPKFVPYESIREAAINVAKAAYCKGVMGYLSVDFVIADSENSSRLFGVDVDLYLTNNAAAHTLACLASNSVWDEEKGECIMKCESRKLSYAYSGLIYSPLISLVRHKLFFTLCQRKGLAFDRQLQCGVVYHMVNVLTCGCIGVLSLGSERSIVARKLKQFHTLLMMELPKQSEHSGESNIIYFASAIHQLVRAFSALGAG